MTDLRKAAEQALEALEQAQYCVRTNYHPGHYWEDEIEALRQALAQPEEKMRIEGNGKLTTKPYPDGYESEQQFRKALAQREWVGLTDEEAREIRLRVGSAADVYAKAIEAKLKEKNV